MLLGNNLDFGKYQSLNQRIQNLSSAPSSPVEGLIYADTTTHQFGFYNGSGWVYFGSGTGTVTSVSVVSANGFAGSVATSTSTPAITISTSITGILKGNGTAISAAVVRTDYGEPTTALATGLLKNTTSTGAHSIAVVGTDYSVGTSALATGILKSTTSTGALSIAVAGDFPTLNQSTTGSAATLTTPRAIYGNNFDGSAALTQIIASTFGGTGNGFTKFAGATTAEKTYTLPDASGTIPLIGSAQTWTGVQQFGTIGGAVGKLVLAGSSSGSTILNAAAVAGSGTMTLPTGTDTLVGKATTDVFTNKTFDAAGTGNVLSNIATSMFAANVVDTDGTLAANSDTILSSQKAIVTYVQSYLQGATWKTAVRAATTAAGTLATSFENADVIDGVTLATGDRILIKDQAAPAENGIYTVNASGAPTRALDADTSAEIIASVVDVREGTVNKDTAWVNSNSSAITLGTTAITFVDFNKSNIPTATTSVQGKVQLATQAEAQAKTDTAKALTAASVADFTRKFTGLIGDGATTAIAVTHGLGTQWVNAEVFDASTNAKILVDYTLTSSTVTTFTFGVAPASNAYRVVIVG